MALIICGTQGSGVNTFEQRCDYHNIASDNLYKIYITNRRAMKTGHSPISGPFLNETNIDSMIEELESQFPALYDHLMKFHIDRPVWTQCAPEFGKWIVENKSSDNHNVLIVSAPIDIQCERLFAREKIRDPRLVGKSNSYQLVKPEYIKEIESHAADVSWLESNADYHMNNDGTLEQYNAAIDIVLNECNLLE
tara:strand:- start:233 stop:814 length:582 start_codon:yes stop_codon:yes gene_type:complete